MGGPISVLKKKKTVSPQETRKCWGSQGYSYYSPEHSPPGMKMSHVAPEKGLEKSHFALIFLEKIVNLDFYNPGKL